jgi:trans-aconitate methyltransferase
MEATADWYGRYDARVGGDRNDILRNREVLFQFLAKQASVVRAIGRTDLNPCIAEVLDVGCGHGASSANLLALGFQSGHIHGVDIQPERVDVARHALPGVVF